MQTFSCEEFLLLQEINDYNYEEMVLIYNQYIRTYLFWQEKLRKIFYINTDEYTIYAENKLSYWKTLSYYQS